MTDLTIEARLERLESLLASGGEMMLKTAEVAQQNAQQITRLGNTMAQLALQAATDRAEFRRTTRATLDSTRAALDKIDRVLDYLIQRDNQPEGDS